ncbi:hypothetical protein H8D79_01145, partial [PVC group bacterium]|nr:hypothetical protein [PVC group bacterium]
MNVKLGLVACLLALRAPGLGHASQIDLATREWRLKTGDDASYSSLRCDDRGWLRVKVPRGWESVVPGYDGIGWYRVGFTVPGAWREQKLVCFPGKIDDRAEVFLNGRSLGEAGGYRQPPSVRLPLDLIRYGKENVLALRVQDYGQRGGLFAGPIVVKPEQLADKLDVQASLLLPRDATPASFQLTVVNRSQDAVEGKLSYEVADYYGEVVSQESLALRLDADQKLSRHIALHGRGCKEYRATVTVADAEGKTIELWSAAHTGKLDGIRKEIVLSGEWGICFADTDDAPPADGTWEKIRVPWFWTKAKAKGALVAWYRRKVSVPKSFAGQQLALRFQAVLFACRVFVNGRYAGEHFGGYSPFEVDVTDLARPG